jgi:hypothetical protein
LACCIAFGVYPGSLAVRVRIASFFVAGCAVGALVSGGYWHYELWRAYGNPVFPLFSHVFQNPLAAPVAATDTRWIPTSWGERIAWPFIISMDAMRAGDLPVRQVIWAIVYAAFIAWGAVVLLRRQRATPAPKLDARARFVAALVGIGFVAWMLASSIYRYLVAIEMLAPLVAFVLLSHSLPRGERVAAWALALSTGIVLTHGMRTRQHADWADAPFRIDAPRIEHPASTTVVIAGGEAWSWLGVGLPRDVALTQVGGNFPEGRAFRPRLEALIARGPAFAVVTAHRDNSAERGKGVREFVEKTGLPKSRFGCALLGGIADGTRARFVVGDYAAGACPIEPRRAAGRDVDLENQRERNDAARILARYGYGFEACELRDAFLAGDHRAFQWCPLRSLSPSGR